MCINGQVLLYSQYKNAMIMTTCGMVIIFTSTKTYQTCNSHLLKSYSRLLKIKSFKDMVQHNFLWHKRRRVFIKIRNNLNVETRKSQSKQGYLHKRGCTLQPYEHSNQSPKCPWREKSYLDLGSLETPCEGFLGDIEGVEDKNMVVVLGKGHHITFTGDLQTATARNLKSSTYIPKTFQHKYSVKIRF